MIYSHTFIACITKTLLYLLIIWFLTWFDQLIKSIRLKRDMKKMNWKLRIIDKGKEMKFFFESNLSAHFKKFSWSVFKVDMIAGLRKNLFSISGFERRGFILKIKETLINTVFVSNEKCGNFFFLLLRINNRMGFKKILTSFPMKKSLPLRWKSPKFVKRENADF